MAAAQPQRVSTRATGVVGVAVMCSRVLGLIREQVFAGLFGAGKNLDAFLIAFRVPNLLRDLFADGALSTAFITTFSKKIATEGDESAWRLGNKVATLTAIFMSAVTLLGIIFAPQIIYVMTGFGGWSPEKTETTILLTRIMWPFILLVSLAALVMGMLNAKNVFGAPAMASSYFNLGSIFGGVAFGYWLDPHFGTRSLIGLSIGTLIGGFWQLTAQFPSLRRVGYKYRPDFQWRDQGVRAVLMLMGPAVIAAAALQFYAIGLAAYSAVKVLAPAFYALDKRYLPMMVSIFSIVVNVALNWFFMFKLGLGHRGLAFAVSLVAIINFLLLYIMMRKYAGPLETGALLALLAKLVVPLGLLAGVCWLSLETMFYPGAHLPEWQRVFAVLLVIAVAAAV